MALEKKLDNCVFCNNGTLSEGLLGESNSFWLRAIVRGTLAPGHVMIISKDHFSCFGQMPQNLDDEYSAFLNGTKQKIRDYFSEPILVEQGVHGQSINHAHIHLFPCVSSWYDFSIRSFADFIPQEVRVTKGKSINDIRQIFEEEGEYVSIEERGELYICHTRNYDGSLRPARQFTAELTGNDDLLYWQKMPLAKQEENKKWIKETIEKLKEK